MIDYKLLEALSAVMTEGGFDKAAKVLGRTQSAVSQRVRQLEEQVGRILISRTVPPVPTPDGKRLIRHFLQVQQLASEVNSELDMDQNQGTGAIAIGLNADSLATWFLDAVEPFLKQSGVRLDLRVDDQDSTLSMLRGGEVIGCISAWDKQVKGCRIVPVGQMKYRLFASPAFTEKWFKNGLTFESAQKAPILIFNRKDSLQNRMFETIFGSVPEALPAFFLPSVEKFVDAILKGFAYGVLPDEQSEELIKTRRIVDVSPGNSVSVPLYWHCWDIPSKRLGDLTKALVQRR